ncbi:armadillo-type protein [Microdochium trichocladiopsis]|uniref:Armadillo-type protein n=1 Tax=Microdochium trichocladiopsis TaxID=1682393 RepID=A0A9P9BUH8_9PEZI|nr:armadillo-type protein [Microdochium trichocladiopsis]KAH7038157.1 armadillo-type protein [Microdochium trichocladiopsis]
MGRRRDEAPEEEDQEMEGEELVSLQFKEPLSWRAGKPIATGELLRRLDKLSKELVDMDQETVDKASLASVAKDLASNNLLGHKEAGVKAYVASCLVDILKLCAPEAPFTPKQLKEIFTLFVHTVLPALWDSSNAYNTQHKYVLTSLAEVKSILLINEVNNSEELLLDLFTAFFDGVSGTSKSASGDQIAKDVEFHMTEILVTLIEESPALPPDVLDVIMAQFLRAAPPGGHREKTDENQTTLLPKEEPGAYVMAKTICNTIPDKMARYVGQYFSDVILDVSGKTHTSGQKDGESDDEDAPTGPSEADFRELRKAHQLLRELWRAAPTVLVNVIPQVDHELATDNVQLRLLATETLGDIISGIGAAGPPPPPAFDPAAYPPPRLSDETPEHPTASILTTPISPLSFAQTHSQAFHNFVSRKNDKSALVRAAWTTSVGYIVSTSAGGIGLSREDESAFVSGLRDKLIDSDEKVRLAAVKAIEAFGFRDVVTKLAMSGGVDKEGSVLFTLADRCRDKKSAIRVEAMVLLAKLWAAATGELAAGQETVTSALSGIPTRIFNTFYANDPELNVLLERVIFEFLVPLSFPPPKAKATKGSNGAQSQATADPDYDPDRIRAERVILLAKHLDVSAKRAFSALNARQPQFSKVMENLVKSCDAYNGGSPASNADIAKANLRKTVAYLCQFLPDTSKVEADLYHFANWHDRRSYQLIRFSVSAESDFKTMQRAIKELIKRAQGSKNPHMLDTLLPLLYRSSNILFNKSHLSTFMDCSKSDKDGLGAAAQEITNEISQHNPDLFKTHVGQLCKDLIEFAPTATKANDASMVEALKACSSYSKKYPQELPKDRKFSQALINYGLHGQPPKAAKYAVNVLTAKNDNTSTAAATDLVNKALKSLEYGSPNFLTKLVAISQVELLAPDATAETRDSITDIAVGDILMKNRTESKADGPEWVAEEDLDEECLAKCAALKLMVNRLRGIDQVDEAKKQAPAVFKLLKTLIKQSGNLVKTSESPAHHRSRLRLRAGQSILKLCTQKHFEEMFTPADFNRLAFMVQDSCAMVRRLFIEKLQKYLVQGKLRPRFYTMIFLAAFEPQADFKAQVETWIRSRARHFRETKQSVMEGSMGRFISLLAHHPDYSPETAELVDHAQYLLFYIRNVVTESNFNTVFKYAERVKQTMDGIDPSKSENLYVISDLATTLLRKWQERKGWSFQAFVGRIGLPVGLYTALPSHEKAQEIAEKNYLPEDAEDALDELLRVADKKKKRKSMDEHREGHPAQKKARSAPKSREPRPPKTKKVAKAKAARKSSKKTRDSGSSAVDDANRRRSGRARNANSSYMERDSDADDDDMLEGVAKWDYYDEDGNVVQRDDDEDDDDEDDEDESGSEAEEDESDQENGGDDKAADDKDEGEEAEPEEDAEDAEEEPEPEPEPEPAKSNGRKGRAGAAAAAAPKALPSRPAAKGAKAKQAAAAPARAPSGRSTRGRRAAAQEDEEGDDE